MYILQTCNGPKNECCRLLYYRYRQRTTYQSAVTFLLLIVHGTYHRGWLIYIL
jgi:hypothetical protein